FPGADDLLRTYQVIGRGLAAGLRRVGVPAELVPVTKARGKGTPTFCFARTGSYELVVGDRKLVGSAQRRQAGAFLQHGSILLDADLERLRLLFPGEEGADPLAGMTTLAAVLGRLVAFDELVPALAAGMGEGLGVELVPGGLTPEEARLVEALIREKYGTEAWNLHAHAAAALGAEPASLRPSC
ncbi:MAG: lipoate--protein ligase family protein, partial [Candidatus Rokubacteria bacterium]|nr:lipoate--protein ligase family protein [Candidatus Rokubacteria bacterium]